MAHELTALIVQYGLLVVFLSTLVEQVGVPVPAFPVLIAAGASAASAQLPVVGVVLAALAGCLLPDLAWYWMGRRLGTRVMRGLCRLSLSPDSCVHQSEMHFEHWRGRSLLIAKFIPGLSLVAPPLVGALGLRLRAFVFLDGIGALLWIGLGVGLGFAFAGQIDRVLAELAGVSKLALAVTLGLLALYIFVKWQRRQRLQIALRMTRATPAELRQALLNSDAPLVLDVRSRISRQLDPRAIAGARLVDPDDLDAVLHDVPLARKIVIYCSCPNEATSAKFAMSLKSKGYLHVRPLSGGLRAWEAAGHPVRSLSPAAGMASGSSVRMQS